MKLCGIDEAGRGCIIGPLVMCAAVIDEEKEETLKKLGVKDSKLLTAKKREALAEKLQKQVKYKLAVIPPTEIDKAVNNNKLNWLEADISIELINILKPGKAILDTPSPNIKAYKAHIQEQLQANTSIIAEHKADVKHPIVAAASILAKVVRDEEIAKIKKNIEQDFGSGYLTDKKTQKFLQENWEKHAPIFRHSWAPYKKIASTKLQKKIAEF